MSNRPHIHEDYTWLEYDKQGIPIAKVCEKCCFTVLSRYSPSVLTEDQQMVVFGQVVDTDSPYCPDECLEEDY
jgi:hypothetical protein